MSVPLKWKTTSDFIPFGCEATDTNNNTSDLENDVNEENQPIFSTQSKLGHWEGPFLYNAASVHCIIHVFILLKEIRDFFGCRYPVALCLYLRSNTVRKKYSEF